MTDTLAILGLLTATTLVALFALALYVHRQTERTNHLARIVLTLTAEREAETGTRLNVDRALLIGEPADVVAPEEDDPWSRVPMARPWTVQPDPEGQ